LEESPELRDCKRHIQVPAWEDFVWPSYYGDTNAGVVDEDDLKVGLNKGFEVKYSVNKECLRCLGSGEGDCRLKNNIIEDSCYYYNCPDGSIAYSSNCSSHHKSMFSISIQ
jgi:hypothetical protein